MAEQKLEFSITSNSRQARADIENFRAFLLKEFGDAQRGGSTSFSKFERDASGDIKQVEATAKKSFTNVEEQAKTSAASMARSFLGGLSSIVQTATGVFGGNLLTSAVSNLASGLKSEISTAFDFNDLKERAQITFTTLFKNAGLSAEEAAKEAKAHIEELIDFGARTPFRSQQLIELSQQLQAVGFKAKEIIPTLTSVGDAVAALGNDPEKLQRIINDLGQIKTTGQVSSREIRELAEAGIPAWQYLADYSGRTVEQVRKLAEKNMLDADVSVKVILAGMEKNFGGMMKQVEGTYSAQWSTIEDLNQMRAAEAFKPAFDEVKKGQAAAIAGLSSGAAEGFTKNAAAIQQVVLGGFNKILAGLASGDFKQLGYNALESVVTGAKEGAKGMYSVAADAAGQAEQGWRDRLDQHSPSQVMLKLGYDAGQSLIDGFRQGVRGQRLSDEIERIIEEAAAKYGLDPNLIRAVIRRESSGNRGATSPVGAMGLMQLMPGTAARYGAANPYDPAQNIDAGAHYLSDLLKMFGDDLRLALAGYNAGEGAVKKYGGVPPYAETQGYVSSVMRNYTRLSTGVDSPVSVTLAGVNAAALPPVSEWLSQFAGPHTRTQQWGGMTVETPEDPRAFAEAVYDLEKNLATSARTTVLAQADYQHQISQLQGRFGVTDEGARLIQNEVAKRLDLERKLRERVAAQLAADGGSIPAGAALPSGSRFDFSSFLKPTDLGGLQSLSAPIKSATQVQYEFLKAIAATGPEAKQAFGSAGKEAQNLGSIIKKSKDYLKDLHDELKSLKDETDFGPMRLAGMTLGEMFKDLRANILDSVDAIVFSGQTLQQALTQAMRNTLAQTAAFLGKKAALKGMEEEAEALSSLAAWDLAGFARHQAAAVGWFALAAAAAIGGQLISGSRSGAAASGGAGGSSSSASQSQPTPNNQTFTYNQTATPSGVVGVGNSGVGEIVNRLERLERAVIEGNRQGVQHTGYIVTAFNNNTQALSTIRTARAGDILERGLNENPMALGPGIKEFASRGGLVEWDLAGDLGFRR